MAMETTRREGVSMAKKTDIFGETAIWLWGKKIPTEIGELQKLLRRSPLGKYIKEIEKNERRSP